MWVKQYSYFLHTLQWRYYECDGVWNHRRLDCLLNRLFRRRTKKTSKPRVTGLCEGNPPVTVTGGFPSQSASNAENVSIWWRHHELVQSAALLKWHRLVSWDVGMYTVLMGIVKIDFQTLNKFANSDVTNTIVNKRTKAPYHSIRELTASHRSLIQNIPSKHQSCGPSQYKDVVLPV